MADEWVLQVGAYITDGIDLFEIIRTEREGPALPRQRYRVSIENVVSEAVFKVTDEDIKKKFEFTCMKMSDEELYKRYKAISKDYKPEPQPKPQLFSEELATKRKNLMCL